MAKALLITLAGVLALPSVATAATATADVKRKSGAPVGPVTFKAARGETNQVTVTNANGRLRFHDDRNRVRARGDCEQVNANTAVCPFTEDIAKVKLGNRADSANVEGLVEVLGGAARDVLRGSRGRDMLDGQNGDDLLRGRGGGDELTGGNGSDFVDGGGGDDDLIDGETDAKATSDTYVGGASRDTASQDRGDQIFYTRRERALNISLVREKVLKGAENDDIAGIESVAAGSGDDKITGDHDDNLLEGNAGDDDIRALGGDDIPMGGNGNDKVVGDVGEDVVWGNGGADSLKGGRQSDLMDADDANAELVSCGPGADTARVTRIDDVGSSCEIATEGDLYVRVQPRIEGDEATFRVACQQLGGCDGTLTLTGPEGEDYGSGSFTDLPDDPQTFSDVSVTLTPAAVTALQSGVIVQVAFGGEGGYRVVMRSS
jgi:Ca2+-binding RTX toxin-like protein